MVRVRRAARRWPLRPVLLLSSTLMVGGCAGWQPRSDAVEAPAAAGNAARSGAPGSPASAEPAVYHLEIDAPPPLRTLLATHLDLARFQNAPQAEGITLAELDRLLAATPAEARSLLATRGHFNAEVRVSRRTGEDGLPRLRVEVEPGPQATIGRLTLDSLGDLAVAVEAGDTQAVEVLATLRNQWPLQPGMPFDQETWTRAKNQALARLRALGYPNASWAGTAAQVDADRNAVRLYAMLDSGPLFRLGELRIEGAQRYDTAAVRLLAGFAPGTPYSEKLLLDYQDRLVKLGLYETVQVDIDPDPAQAAATPVTVHLREQPAQQALLGAGYTANTGPRVTVEHLHRRPFGFSWIAHNKLEVGPQRRAWDGSLTSYPRDNRYRHLLSVSAEDLRTTDEQRRTVSLRAGRSQDTERFERLLFVEWTQSQLRNPADDTRADALSLNQHWLRRDLDSVLLPTLGTTIATQLGAGQAQNNHGARGPFLRAWLRTTWYRPIGRVWYATLRGEAGQVFARQPLSVPDPLLFRAGGDDSVRGYAYRSLGPLENGAVRSGSVMATGSAELARPLFADRPQFWGAAFIDAGNAAYRWGELNPALGYGIGLRWRSPVGPLRVDLAYGQRERRVRAHMSVGIAY